jgi:O-antigen biosynthesis protein
VAVTAIITAVYGAYDPLRPLPEGHGFDVAVCVTDNPELSADGWTTLFVPRNDNPRLSAKHPKMLPFDFVDADVSVWLDASAQVVNTGFRDWCADVVDGHDLVAWSHPEDRSCLYQEADYCWSWPKYRHMPLREQVAHYRSDGMPALFGLWACGTMVWANTQGARDFGRAWLDENVRWSTQDQVSFAYLLWKRAPKFAEFPAHEFQNSYLSWHPHGMDD